MLIRAPLVKPGESSMLNILFVFGQVLHRGVGVEGAGLQAGGTAVGAEDLILLGVMGPGGISVASRFEWRQGDTLNDLEPAAH